MAHTFRNASKANIFKVVELLSDVSTEELFATLADTLAEATNDTLGDTLGDVEGEALVDTLAYTC